MKNKIKLLLPVLALILSLMIGACKPTAKVELNELYGEAIKIIGTTRTNLSVFASVFNSTTGIEVSYTNWSFKIYSGDELLLEINKDNYQTFSFNVSVSTPIPSYYTNNLLLISMGIPAYKSGTTETDLFQGKEPGKLVFDATVEDINGHVFTLTGETTVTYREVEGEED